MAIDERLVFYEGTFVRLKVLSEEDVHQSEWVGWFNGERYSNYHQHHYFPNTVPAQLDLLRSLEAHNKFQLGIVDRTDESSICGVVSLSDIDLLHRKAEISGIQAVDRTAANPAIFWEAWSLVLRHGFEQLGLNKIYGGTFHPQVTKALQRMFGFEVEGVRRREVFKDNAFHDTTLLAVFHDSVTYPRFD